MSQPLPGRSVRGSRSGRPVMALLDLLGRRWTLRIIWELRAKSLTFRDLQARCDNMSPSVLNARLGELRAALLVTVADGEGYALTQRGQELLTLLRPLGGWAERWAQATRRQGVA